VLHGYIVVGATKLMKDEPSRIFMLPNDWSGGGSKLSSSNIETPPSGTDYSYTLDIMSLGLLWHGFHP